MTILTCLGIILVAVVFAWSHTKMEQSQADPLHSLKRRQRRMIAVVDDVVVVDWNDLIKIVVVAVVVDAVGRAARLTSFAPTVQSSLKSFCHRF